MIGCRLLKVGSQYRCKIFIINYARSKKKTVQKAGFVMLNDVKHMLFIGS
jgi:hypothetical protein